jgi:hypothetical protein
MDGSTLSHNELISLLRPDGLVVTPFALRAAEANVTWPVTELQDVLDELAGEGKVVLDVRAFLGRVLGWSDEFVVEQSALPDALRVRLDGGETLEPTWALQSADDPSLFILAATQVPWRVDLDAPSTDKRWTASAHQRFERLLRESGVHAGLVTNGKTFRLVYAPRGESAGSISFELRDMLTVDGRPLLGAMHMLLNERRLLALAEGKRLTDLLRASRQHQNAVSKALREQVLSALRELLAGFQQADRLVEGRLLRDAEDALYPGLVSVLMRMVFVLFAEERGLLPLEADLYASSYSLTRLHAQLQEDASRYGETLDDRYGAWARVLSLFRLLHDGTRAADGFMLPARKGALFDPATYPFLEGRGGGTGQAEVPRISDGTVLRILDRLLVLDGERLRYSGLDVEHVGSVYEGLMGFEVHVARGPSLALQPKDVVVELGGLLGRSADDRVSFLKNEAGLDVKGRIAEAVRDAASIEDLAGALGRRASPRQPDLIPEGALFLQPGEERRKFGAHYTSRDLTRVVVGRALAPLLRDDMPPEEILALKICDPALGSGAFLVEACRQLADRLVASWERSGATPSLPPDQDVSLHARRLVAQRCLYGVDKNPLAVDLARLSLWLVTFAREHPFTFVDHALRHGDSLVGLSREQIGSVSWDVGKGTNVSTVRTLVEGRLRQAEKLRRGIIMAADPLDNEPLVETLSAADTALRDVRIVGDLMLEAFFSIRDKKAQGRALAAVSDAIQTHLAAGSLVSLETRVAKLRQEHAPFHWEVEFPEVFADDRRGFDAFVGNPPWVSYAGKAAQPLDDDRRDLYSACPAFAGFRNLQALFVHRCAGLLRPGGRLGFVLPTSMSDLGGYEPSRRAHDVVCVCDEELPDFGEDAFDGVFQPCMGLLSTRRSDWARIERAGAWPLHRPDLDADTAALLERLAALPRLPPDLFGERGFQTTGDDVTKLYTLAGPQKHLTVGVRVGSDIEPFLRRPPQLYCDPSVFGSRFRPPSHWQAVELLIRQTARFPMAVLSDGLAFRNSILAGFANEQWSAFFMLAYLNSNPIRFFHYMRHRDARQGMPQMKIAHLRALPAPDPASRVVGELAELGRRFGERNTGLQDGEQDALDRLAADALGLSEGERARVRDWALSVRG